MAQAKKTPAKSATEPAQPPAAAKETATQKGAAKQTAKAATKAAKKTPAQKAAAVKLAKSLAKAAKSAPAMETPAPEPEPAADEPPPSAERRSPLKDPNKDPKGGLTAAGRKAFLEKDGAHLRPGVKGSADTPEKLKRKGSFLTRHFTNPRGPMLRDGEPTRLALSAQAWGEPIPTTEVEAKKLANKGRLLLEQYHKAMEARVTSKHPSTGKAKADQGKNRKESPRRHKARTGVKRKSK